MPSRLVKPLHWKPGAPGRSVGIGGAAVTLFGKDGKVIWRAP